MEFDGENRLKTAALGERKKWTASRVWRCSPDLLRPSVRASARLVSLQLCGSQGLEVCVRGNRSEEKKSGERKKLELEGRRTEKKEIEKTDLDLSIYNSYHRYNISLISKIW
jgi:hypothetical protein